jgi:RNA methyltransferase, TrmH family
MRSATQPSIESIRNPRLQELRRALTRGELTADGCAAVEGRHLLDEALRSALEVVRVFASRDPGVDSWTHVPESILAAISSTETSPGVIALVRLREPALPAGPALSVYLDGVQDPGNAGTIIRSAEAFGATEVILGEGSVRPLNPKLMRASAGSIFRLAVHNGSLPDLPCFAADAHAGVTAREVDWRNPCVLAIGSEAHGLSAETLRRSTRVRIPTTRVESLNAAISASILLYEAARQRGTV